MDELYHHGILGQRWGVIRKLHSSGGNKGSSKKNGSDEKKTIDVEKKKQQVVKAKSAKVLYANKDIFSDDELRTIYNRLTLEDSIKNLSSREISKGEQYVDKFIKVGNKVGDVTNAGIKGYNGVAKIYNTFSEEGKKNPLPLIKDGDGKKKKK